MKVCLIVFAGLVTTWFLRKRSAAVRHWVLAATIVCAMLMPALEMLVPSWHLPAPQPTLVSVPPAVSINEAFSLPIAPGTTPAAPPVSFGGVLQIIWTAGSAIALAVLVAGLGRLQWLVAHAREAADERWKSVLGPVRLLESDHPTLLVTWGFARPEIILPLSARQWSDERMRVVLWHELAHIQRGDWLVQMIAEVLRAFYWFNPLIWIMCRRLRFESEQACDDAVLKRGIEGPEYATELLGLARDLRQRHWLPAPAMARPSSLKRRVSAMLNAQINRDPLSTAARAAIVLALLVVAIPIAAAQTFGSLSGTVMDGQGLPLPDATLVLSNAQRNSKYEVRSSADGAFEFVGLPAGAYTLDVKVIGFATFHETMSIAAGQNLKRALTLRVGSLQESITVVDAATDNSGAAKPRSSAQARPFQPEDLSGCAVPAVGGNIKAPKKIKDVGPQYPENLRGSGTEAVVVLDATIGLDGFPKNIEVHEGANPEFADAAVTAVREWQYTQTILNCSPIEVQMTVTTRFRSQR